jgi:anaerobic selenocysteine-containing dehydrogenase
MHHSEHRQIRSLRKLHPHPIVEINPETARQQGIGDGEWVIIESPRGKIKQKAKLTSRITPRTIGLHFNVDLNPAVLTSSLPSDIVSYRILGTKTNGLYS